MPDIKVLKDEELKKVTGGLISPDSEGYYSFVEGESYRDFGDAVSFFIILETKRTKNTNDTVYCKVMQSIGDGNTSYRNVRVYQLINTRKN